MPSTTGFGNSGETGFSGEVYIIKIRTFDQWPFIAIV